MQNDVRYVLVHVSIFRTLCSAVGLLVLTGMLMLVSSAPGQQVDKNNLVCLELATVVRDCDQDSKDSVFNMNLCAIGIILGIMDVNHYCGS